GLSRSGESVAARASVGGEGCRAHACAATRDRLRRGRLRALQPPRRRTLPGPRRTLRIHLGPHRVAGRPAEYGGLTRTAARQAGRHAALRRPPRRATAYAHVT